MSEDQALLTNSQSIDGADNSRSPDNVSVRFTSVCFHYEEASDECERILDAHIRNTIDTFTDGDVRFYTPLQQESYDNFEYVEPSYLADIRQSLTMSSTGSLPQYGAKLPAVWAELHKERKRLHSTQTAYQVGWRFSCKQCDKRFNTSINLDSHVDAVHRGKRPHKCDKCEKAFAQKATLRTHNRTHTGEKPYACESCKKRFADLSTFKKHKRVHDGTKPYECPICRKKFSQAGNMTRHKAGHENKNNNSNNNS